MAKPKPPGNKTRDWILRIVIFGVLGVVLVLAYMDYQKKQQATETGKAWRQMLTEANDNNAADLPLEKLNDGMNGSPSVAENDQQNVYTWKGPFRDYVITVTYDQTRIKAVNEIDGP